MGWKKNLDLALSKWKELMSGHEEYKLILKDISAIQQDLQEPPIVMIAGEFKAGKSTFINAWLGEKILTADVTPATAVVTKLTYGKTKKVIGHFKNGETKEYDEQWLEQLTAEREGRFGFVRKQLSHIELKLPVEKLQHVTIVDSPGLNATIDHHTDATEMFLHRADKMIWLFNYQFFGTSTEVAELKKINELGITPVGVVNRIDLHDEEEEELSEFLDGERRKFRSLISGLTGVSALEALEGKLENNDTKLKWSNWAEVEKIFETLKAEDNKPQRMFERLKKPLQQLDQLWINKKADAGFYELQPLVYSFFDHDLPRVLKDREQIEEKLLQMDQQFSIVEEAISSLSNTESFEELTQSSHSHGIDLSKKNWEDKVQFKARRYQRMLSEYNDSLRELEVEERRLNDSWATLKDAKFFGKKKVGQFEQEQFTYNVAVKEAKEKEKALSKQQDSLTRLLKEWANIHELGLRKPLEKQVNEMRALCKNWNATYTKLSQTYQELGQEQIIRLQDYLSVLEQWIEAFEPLFEEVEEEVSFLKPFQECQYLFENIEGLHEFLPLEQVMEEYESLRKLDAYSFGKLTSKRAEAHIDVSHLACLQLEQAPTEMRFPSAEKLYELSSKQAWTNGLTVVAAIVFVIVLYNQDKGFVEQEAFVLSEVEEVAAEEVEVEERILEEYWPREDVERFMMAMADELSRFISGYEQFNMSKWFVEDSWNGYRPHVESIYDSQFEYFDVTEIEYSGDDEILVRTIEHINQNEFVTIYHGQYTLMEVDNGEMRIVASSHDVMEVIEPDYHIYNEDLSAFLRQFRADYMVALNEGYFSYIESYLSESGRAYSGLRDYVQSISGQGHYFDFQVFDVQSIEKLGSNQYRVKTYEEFVFTSNEGKQTAYQKEKEYLVQALSETTFSILQIEDLHTVREEIIVRTIDNVSSWQVEDFIERYYRDFIYAFNGAGFSYVEEYFIQGNSEYNATVNYIANANEKEMHVQNQFLRVDGIWEHDDTRLLVEVEVVDAYSYRDGSGDEKRVSVDYLIHVSEYGTMRIEEIPRLDILEEYRYDAVENEGE